MSTETFNLATAQGLLEFLRERKQFYLTDLPTGPSPSSMARYHCSRCMELRQHFVFVRLKRSGTPNYQGDPVSDFCPAVFVYQCTDCKLETFATLLALGSERHLALVPIRSGLWTTNTPPAVRYWLDQARKAEYGGATSLAAAGFRVAIDQILLSQGVTGRTLGNKLQDLGAKLSAGTAPAWASGFDLELLRNLKAIGDGCLHADDSDVERLSEVDHALLRVIDSVVLELLDAVYEEPVRAKERAERLAAAKAKIKPTDLPAQGGESNVTVAKRPKLI